MKFTPEQLAKAKTAKSAEELFAYAKEIGAPMNEDEAKVFFEQWHKEDELADEELENVSGGSQIIGCSTYSSDPPYHLITTTLNSCDLFVSKYPGWAKECQNCINTYVKGPTRYCACRSAKYDPYNPEVTSFG